MDVKAELIKIAGELAQRKGIVSCYEEDLPKTTPRRVVEMLKSQDAHVAYLAHRLGQIARAV